MLSLGHGETTPCPEETKTEKTKMTYSTAQNFLTLAANATLYTAIALSILYILRWTFASPATEPALDLSDEVTPDPEPIRVLPHVPAAPRPAGKTMTAIAVTVKTEAGKKPTIREMRKALTDAGIKGAGKWNKAKCEEELTKLN